MEWLQIFFKEQKNREYVTLGFVTTNEQHSQHLTTWHNYMLSCSWRKTNALSPTTSRVERRAISCSSYYLLWFLLIHLRSFASFSPILISHAKPTSASQLFSLIFLFWSLLSTPVTKKKGCQIPDASAYWVEEDKAQVDLTALRHRPANTKYSLFLLPFTFVLSA